MPSELTQFLKTTRRKRAPTLNASLGFFDPTGLNVALTWGEGPNETTENRVAAMGALLHERMHWLQFIGTSAGHFSASLATLQAGLLFKEEWHEEPLSAADLPLLDCIRVPDDERTLWLACERDYAAIFGGPRPQLDGLERIGATFQLEAISRQLRDLGARVVRDHPSYERLQESLWAKAEFPKGSVMMLDHDGVGLGATHCMETAARANEIFRLEEGLAMLDENWALDEEAYWFDVYAVARALFFQITGRRPGEPKAELAMCVLADWALNCPLPPMIPFSGSLEKSPGRFPGPFFAVLSHEVEVDTLPEPAGSRIEWANQATTAIYDQISEKVERVLTPLDMARTWAKSLEGLDEMSVPDDIYRKPPSGPIEPVDGVARLRYLSILWLRAARLRLEHPSFFALPFAYYATDRKFFHELWDPLEPPLVSSGPNRFVPTVDDPNWFAFFYLAAVQHVIGITGAYLNCQELGGLLREYRGTLLKPEEETTMITVAVNSFLGSGEASRQVLVAAGL
jgi:hypothetical protein